MTHVAASRITICLFVCLAQSSLATTTTSPPGDQVDIAPFGHVCTWTGTTAVDIERHPLRKQELADCKSVWIPGEGSPGKEPHIGVEWDFPQDVAGVEAEFARAEDASLPGENALEYWHDSWPPQDRGGWTRLDDPFNGTWKRPKANFRREGNRWIYQILPLSKEEVPASGDVRVAYRRTYKVRIVFADNRFPPIAALRVLSPHKWKEAELRIETGVLEQKPMKLTSADVFCGHLLSPLQPVGHDEKTATYSLRVLYSDSADDSPDRTIVTIQWGRSKMDGVSFLVKDAVREGVFVPDFGLWIVEKDGRSFEQTDFSRASEKPGTIWEKVAAEPEQTYERARAEIPPLGITIHKPYGRYIPLGCDGNRQEFGVLYNGNVLCMKRALKSPGREDDRMQWPGDEIIHKIGTGASPDYREREGAAKQSLLDGYLPVVNTEWGTGGLVFRESAVASLLVPKDADPANLRGDETSVLLVSLTAENVSDDPLPARVWLITGPAETLDLRNSLVYAVAGQENGEAYREPRLRCFVETGESGKTPSWAPVAADAPVGTVGFETTLQPKTKRRIVFKIPFLSSLTDEETRCLRNIALDREVERTLRYWQSKIEAGARIRVPNALLNDFVRAQFWHIAVTADRDVDTGLTMLPAATFHYNVCANEACHQIRSLDLRGYAKLAEECLEPFIQLQGTRPLHGRFRSSEGVLHGLRVKEGVDYQTFNYNLDHGFVLWMLCEHYRLTGDKEWLRRVAPNVVKGCDFIIRERQATKLTDQDGKKVWQYGLLPPGHLEDNPEFLHWYAVNAYASRGMWDAAEVLAEIGSPDAERIRKEAEEYQADVRQAARRSMLLSPVVNQGGGTYVPFQPTRCLLRGRDLGWIRDCLYGPIHLLDCGIYRPESREATWILKDAENDVFVGGERGLGIDTRRWWFSHGGMTLQPNLVPTPIVYVRRDEPERAIRCFYNTLTASVYEDVRAFCEWLPPPWRGRRGGGPLYKTPDESAFVVWLRYLLAVEDGNRLTLCPAVPREWFADGEEIIVERLPTYFGEVSFRVVSQTEKGQIHATVSRPSRRPPKELWLRIRHPQQKPIREVQVNGNPHRGFNAAKETVFLPATGETLDVVVEY